MKKPNLKLNLGRTVEKKDINIDLGKDHVHTIFLTGSTGTGKSILHNYLYKQLMEQNELRKLKFVFMDMTRVDFTGWKGPSIYWPIIVDPKKALDYLVEISENPPVNQITVIHIEECDMMALDPVKFETAWQKIHEAKNIYVVFSTSRPAQDVFTKMIKEHTDMIISCQLSSKEDSDTVLGSPGAEKLILPGEKIISINGKQTRLAPYNTKELQEIERFEKYTSHDPEYMKQYDPIVRHHANVIEKTLESYGIRVRVAEIGYLPKESIEYRLEITQGTKITDIVKRKKELALALASSTGTIEIQAPIPGRSLIGITVPKVPIIEQTRLQSQSSLLGIMLRVIAVLFESVSNFFFDIANRVEIMKNVTHQLIVIALVAIVIAATEPGGFDWTKAYKYFFVSFLTWLIVLGVQEYGKKNRKVT